MNVSCNLNLSAGVSHCCGLVPLYFSSACFYTMREVLSAVGGLCSLWPLHLSPQRTKRTFSTSRLSSYQPDRSPPHPSPLQCTRDRRWCHSGAHRRCVDGPVAGCFTSVPLRVWSQPVHAPNPSISRAMHDSPSLDVGSSWDQHSVIGALLLLLTSFEVAPDCSSPRCGFRFSCFLMYALPFAVRLGRGQIPPADYFSYDLCLSHHVISDGSSSANSRRRRHMRRTLPCYVRADRHF